MDYTKEVKELLKKYSDKEVIFGKDENYLLERISATKEDIIEDLFLNKDLIFTEKQYKTNEIRYALFYAYSKKKGRVYAITFLDKIRIITAYPLGRKTLLKYKKKRFIN